jgi:hydroxypyruvate reductase
MVALHDDAEAIWQAAINSVQPQRLIRDRLQIDQGQLLFDGLPLNPPLPIGPRRRLIVVGGGKAAAGLAAGLEDLFPSDIPLQGLIGVPEGCGLALSRIEVREVRPLGRNEPTDACVIATHQMLSMLHEQSANDIALAVVTGGGSAILTAPLPGIELEDIVATTRWLSEHAADIGELNRVRQAVSNVKAGGLARSCRAGRLVVLVISDVIGDPLTTISSGPCMPVNVNAREVLDLLERFGAVTAGVAPSIVTHLQKTAQSSVICSCETASGSGCWQTPDGCLVSHHVLGSNATAVAAAAAEAARRGYVVRLRHADPAATETADEVGERLAAEGLAAACGESVQRLAIIEGGEATVQLPESHGVGGRNQQTVAAALAWIKKRQRWPSSLLIASVGTDGEDGPTCAAGGVAHAMVAKAIEDHDLRLPVAVQRYNAFPLLEAAGGLIHTGPTGTNVADVRIVLVSRDQTSQRSTA